MFVFVDHSHLARRVHRVVVDVLPSFAIAPISSQKLRYSLSTPCKRVVYIRGPGKSIEDPRYRYPRDA